MAETIKLKSKAVSIYDYHQVDISRFITGFSVDEAQYRKDLERILRRFGRRESVSQVGSGDAVIVNSRSTLPRFCWDGMTVMVGKGILNREFEAQLIGMTVGERKTVFVDGGEASVEIVSVTRTVLPELTDEIVASFQMEGISTVSDLRRYCIGKQVETFLLEDEVPDTASAFVWQEVAKNSKINRDAEEVAHINCEADRKIWEMTANYPGAAMVTGPELNRLYQEQIARAGLEITERQVTNILANRRGFMLQAGDEIFDAKTVLLATGSVSPTGFPGEAELLGHGVSYCATCDGFLYPGKAIAVYCGSREFEHEVIYLAEIAAKVYLFTPYSDCEIIRENITVNPGKLKSICGQEAVTGVTLTDGTILNVDGVFVLRNAVAPGTLLRGLELDGANIAIDRQMRTNKPGCFAAGDCTGRPYQLAKAVGEGNIAAHSIVAYLAEKDKQ